MKKFAILLGLTMVLSNTSVVYNRCTHVHTKEYGHVEETCNHEHSIHCRLVLTRSCTGNSEAHCPE